jgi:hypothetical protein
MPVVSALGRLRYKDHKFEDSLSYKAKLCLKQTNKKTKMQNA